VSAHLSFKSECTARIQGKVGMFFISVVVSGCGKEIVQSSLLIFILLVVVKQGESLNLTFRPLFSAVITVGER